MWDRFAHPEWLVAALAVALVTGGSLLVARAVARRRRLRLVGSTQAPAPPLRVNDLALLVALFAILVALLGPRIGERELRLPGNGVDVVILVDVSRSMDARDVPPSRLDRARQIAGDVVAGLDPRDRVALAAFGSRGVLLTPLTPDRAALAELLVALDSGLIHPAGSDLGAGLSAAVAAFSEGSARPRVVLALADGEDPKGRSDLAGGILRRTGARVIAVALGTEAGSTIPDRGAELRDRSGAVVVTRRRASRLDRVVEASGGVLFLANEWGRVDSHALLAELRRDARSVTGEPVVRRVAAVQVLPFAALAFFLLLVEGLPRGRRLGRSGAALALVALPLLAATSNTPADTEASADDDPRILVWVGLDRLERGERDAAARAFEAAAITADDRTLAALAYYDLAVTELERGDLERARDALFDALALSPGDRQARFNLEWTLRALAAAAPPSPERALEGRVPPGPSDREEAPIPPSSADADSGADAPPRQGELRRQRRAPPDEATRERWMERVEDDLARALQAAATPKERVRGAGPAW
jgi:Ca-activated chloride channel family protein